MRLTIKLTLALGASICTVLIVYTLMRLQRESQLFERDVRRDHSTMGRVLAGAIEHTWLNAGPDAALEVINTVNRREPNVEVRWIWLDTPVGGPPGPLLDSNQLVQLQRDGEISIILPSDGDDRALVSYSAVRTPEGRQGAIEFTETLALEQQYLRTTVLRAGATTLILVLLCAGLALGLGYWLVGRPMQQLVGKVRRVGAGDLSDPIVLHQRDEIGILAGEMNAMCDRLAEANDRVRAETAARITALEQLRHVDRLSTVGKLAAGVAHELGTPLNVVAARATMIAEGEVTGEAAAGNARIIAEQTERMTRIIRQLLDYARQGRPDVRVEDLRRVTQCAVELLLPLAGHRKVALEYLAGDTPMAVRIDAAQVQQVLMNVIVNAVQAMDSGGRVQIAIEGVRAHRPAAVGEGAGDFVRVEVVDRGQGIAPENLGHLFEPFFTTKDVGEGTGLGLAVAYGIVLEHHGWIDVQSEPGQGSRFGIYLPAEPS